MKTATRYTAHVATNMENAVRHMQPAQRLTTHRTLPTTNQEITQYIEQLLQLLTKDEKAVSDMAAD